jgi:hypothetical protein
MAGNVVMLGGKRTSGIRIKAEFSATKVVRFFATDYDG